MRRLSDLALYILYLFPVIRANQHPFTFEDMMKLKRVGEPVPSPDGKWVLFSAVDVDLASEQEDAPYLDRSARRREKHARSFPIRTAIARAGRRMESTSHFCRPKKADRRSGLPTSMGSGQRHRNCTS